MGRALNVIGVPTSASMFTCAIEGLTSLNESILRANPGLPRLYESGVRYSKADTDKWRTVLDVLDGRNGPKLGADCEALAPWLAAERRVFDGDTGAQALIYPSGSNKFHAVVMRGDGTIEDPSLVLGMKAPPELAENYRHWNENVAPQIVQPGPGATAVMGFDMDVACVGVYDDDAGGAEVTFDVERTANGFRGHFRLPFIDGRALYGATSTAASPEEAEQKATNVLGLVGSLWDDVAALVPGSSQAQAAIRIARNQHVQNLAKAAFEKTKSAFGQKKAPPPPPIVYMPDAGSSTDFWSRDPGGDGSGYSDGGDDDPSVDGTGRGVDIIGYINATLAAGSRPNVGALPGGGLSRMTSGGSGSRAPSATQRGGSVSPSAPGYHAAPAPSPASPYSPTASTYVNPYTGQPYGASPYYGANAPGYSPAGSLPYYGQQPPPGLSPGQRQNWLQNMAQQMVAQQAGGGGGSSGGGGGGGGGDYGPPSYGPDYGSGDSSASGQAIDNFYGGYNMPDQDFYSNAALAQQINQQEGGEYGINGIIDPDDFHGGEQAGAEL